MFHLADSYLSENLYNYKKMFFNYKDLNKRSLVSFIKFSKSRNRISGTWS